MDGIDKSSLEPCPFCGSRNLTFDYKMSHGHGDCGYEHARIVCLDCDATKGLHNYGEPGKADTLKAAEAWNTRGASKIQVKLINETKDGRPSMYDTTKIIEEKYGKAMSIRDFLSLFNPTQNKKE